MNFHLVFLYTSRAFVDIDRHFHTLSAVCDRNTILFTRKHVKEATTITLNLCDLFTSYFFAPTSSGAY